MITPPIPVNERDRLKALMECQILDTLQQSEFDNITSTAAEVCDAPVALICLVDHDRQWFKSHYGLDIKETVRDIGFSAHAINYPQDVLEVPDTLLDERFHDNPLVIENPHVRFYSGAPILDSNGLCLGVLCVLDFEPSELTKGQTKMLRALAQQAATQIELHKKNQELEEKNNQIHLKGERWKGLVEHLGDMIFEVDIKGRFSYVNPSFIKISGHSEDELLQLSFWELVHINSRPALIEFYKDIFKRQVTSSYYEFSINGKEDTVWVGQNVKIEFENGRAVHGYGVARDITERIKVHEKLLESEKKHRVISENSKDIISLHNSLGESTFISDSVTEILGYTTQELQGSLPRQIMHPEDSTRVLKQVSQGLKENRTVDKIECRLKTKKGVYKWVEANVNTIKKGGYKIVGFQASTRDISDRKNIEEEIQRKQYNLEALIENTDDAVVLVDRDLNYISFNEVYENNIAADTTRLFTEGLRLQCHEFIELVEQGLKGDRFKKLLKFQSNDRECYYDCHFNPVLNSQQVPLALAVQMRDVTEKTLMSRRSDEYKKTLSILNEIISNAHITTPEQINRILEVGRNFLGLSNGIISKIDGNDFTVVYCQSPEEASKIPLDTTFALENTFCEITFRQLTTQWVDQTNAHEYYTHPCYKSSHVYSYVGTPYFVTGHQRGTINFSSHKPRPQPFSTIEIEFVNILSRWVGFLVEKHEHSQELLNELDFLRAFISSSPAAIAMFNKNVEYVAVSNKWLQDYNVEAADLLGKSHYDQFPWTRNYWETIFSSGLKGKVHKSEEYKLVRHDGVTQWIKWEVRPWYQNENSIGGLVIYTQDITERREQEQELRKAKSLAEQASKAKEAFLSTMSHEIRTPMNTIIGVSNLLMEDNLRPDQLNNVEMLKFSSQNLLGIINDILDFNKIEAGKIEFEAIDFDLKKLLLNIKQSFQQKSQEQGIDLLVDYDTALPNTFIGDSLRISQVINNLISNAIKFTHDGFVKISVASVATNAEQHNIQFQVKDSGIGMEKEEITKVFEDFSQGKQDTSRKFGGTGLGLSITKRLLALMGSDIEVKSNVGKGSTFTFQLTLTAGKDDNNSEIPANEVIKMPNADSVKVLIVEDNKINITILQQFLSRWGIVSSVAMNGFEAIEKVKSENFNLIIMDVRMPEMDGYEATIAIRALEGAYFREIPIIALTASATSDIKEKVKSVGMNDFLTKPFDPDELFAKISQYTLEGGSERFTHKNPSLLNSTVYKSQLPYLYQICDGDNQMILDILTTIVETVPSELNKISSLYGEKNFPQLAEKIHKIKPNLQSLELKELFTLADRLDKAASQNDEIFIKKSLSGFIASILKELTKITHQYLH